MLSIFPQLLFPFLAPLIVRMGVALVFLVWSWQVFAEKRWKDLSFYMRLGMSTLTTLSAFFVLVGFLTQAAVLVLLLITLYFLVFDKEKERLLKILLIFALISLLLSGPGAFAFDIPL